MIRTFFTSFVAEYTEKWDVPKEFNSSDRVPEEMRHLPVSIKTCKYGSPIGFGDAIRQFGIHEDFVLIVGFWQQAGPVKNFVAAEAVRISSHQWKQLFEPITPEILLKLDQMIKDFGTHYSTVRTLAKATKNNYPFTDSVMVINPKIDSKKQRRLQCSLPFKAFWNLLEKAASSNTNCSLLGIPIPNPFMSPPRTFRSFDL